MSNSLLFNRLLLKIRSNLNLSQLAFSKLTGISKFTIANIETYRSPIKVEDLAKVKDSLDLSWQEFGKMIDEI
jgi:transcriptional regulator with XRE-family HTH domain